jgi:cytochrome c biogenesis protein CcdA
VWRERARVDRSAVFALAVVVVTIGLVDSLNPSTVAPAVLIATGKGAVAQLIAFTLGVFAVMFVGGLVLVLGPGQVLLGALPHPSPELKHVAELAGGVVLIGLAAAAWVCRRRLGRDLTRDRGGRLGPGVLSALGLGAGIMAVELPTAVPYFAAIAAILGADVGAPAQVILVCLYDLAFVLPLVAIIMVRVWAGCEPAGVLMRVRGWIGRRAGAIVASLLTAAGSALLGLGIAGIA